MFSYHLFNYTDITVNCSSVPDRGWLLVGFHSKRTGWAPLWTLHLKLADSPCFTAVLCGSMEIMGLWRPTPKSHHKKQWAHIAHSIRSRVRNETELGSKMGWGGICLLYIVQSSDLFSYAFSASVVTSSCHISSAFTVECVANKVIFNQCKSALKIQNVKKHSKSQQ